MKTNRYKCDVKDRLDIARDLARTYLFMPIILRVNQLNDENRKNSNIERLDLFVDVHQCLPVTATGYPEKRFVVYSKLIIIQTNEYIPKQINLLFRETNTSYYSLTNCLDMLRAECTKQLDLYKPSKEIP